MLIKTFASIAMLGLVGVVQAADQASVLAQEMRNELGGVLWPAFFEKGPLEALHICHEQAQTIAANHSDERVSISRVSHKARNPVNEVPAWAAHYYEQCKRNA